MALQVKSAGNSLVTGDMFTATILPTDATAVLSTGQKRARGYQGLRLCLRYAQKADSTVGNLLAPTHMQPPDQWLRKAYHDQSSDGMSDCGSQIELTKAQAFPFD